MADAERSKQEATPGLLIFGDQLPHLPPAQRTQLITMLGEFGIQTAPVSVYTEGSQVIDFDFTSPSESETDINPQIDQSHFLDVSDRYGFEVGYHYRDGLVSGYWHNVVRTALALQPGRNRSYWPVVKDEWALQPRLTLIDVPQGGNRPPKTSVNLLGVYERLRATNQEPGAWEDGTPRFTRFLGLLVNDQLSLEGDNRLLTDRLGLAYPDGRRPRT